MKKTLSKILVSLCMLGIFLLPLAGQIDVGNKKITINVTKLKAIAQYNGPGYYYQLGSGFWIGGASWTQITCDQAQANSEANGAQIQTPCQYYDQPPSGIEISTGGNSGEKYDLRIQGSDTPNIDFGCGYNPKTWFTNCIIATIYYLIFTPLSWITTGTAQVLDYFVYYSTSDTSYRNAFVEKGWGTVRDIANVMFIIGLLFIAIKTILGLNTTNNKRILGNIIIFALLINFSLFATQVIVDSSNILAKIFYNQITPVDKNGVPLDDKNAQRSVTVGIVDKFKPQKLLSEGTNTVGKTLDLSDRKGQTFLVIILLIALMCFMIYIFLSVSFLFVARTVSIWMAMILAPIAFASQAIDPHMKGLGWSEWLSNLLKSAFMAPIFIFFLYIIILFGDLFALGGFSATGGEDTNIAAFMATFIPFMLIFVLLSQAKKLAVTYSGEMGNAMTKMGGALTAVALGGAALGTAALGRNTVGAVSKYVQNDNARKKVASGGGFKDQWNKGGLSRYNPFAYAKEAGKFMTARVASGIHKIPTTTSGVSLGKAMQNADKSYGHQQHSAHVLQDKAAEMAGSFGLKKDTIKYSELTETQQEKIKEAVDKDTISKKTYNKKFEALDAEQAISVDSAMAGRKVDPKTKELIYTIDAIFKDPKSSTGYRNEIITSDVAFAAATPGSKLVKPAEAGEAHEMHAKQNAGMGEFVRATRTGSYDARDLSKTAVSSKGFLAKLTVGIIGAVALGMRTGIKTSLGSSYGTSSKDMTKDMGNLIKEALKDVKLEIKTDGGGGHVKPSGGGGHGGGGAHH